MKLPLTILLSLLTPFGVIAFMNAPRPPSMTRSKSMTVTPSSSSSSLFGSRYDPYDEGPSRGDALERNKARTDLRNFLTQRSIQSFVYLLNQVRDEQTVRFLENTLDFKKIDSYHGTGAFNITQFPTWDSIFLDLVTRPVDTVVVTFKQRQRRRGFGAGNNYMDKLAGGSSSSSNAKKKSETSLPKRKKPTRAPQGNMGLGSYLDHLSRKESSKEETASASSTTNDDQKQRKMKPKQKKRTAGGMGLGSYLDTLRNNSTDSQPKDASPKQPRKNPFMEKKKYIEYEIEIDPASVLTRIISVREQISEEWSHDLDILIRTNDQILVSYVDYQKEARVAASEEDDDDDFEEDDFEQINDDDDEELKVEDLTAPYSDHRKDELIVFDKDAMVMLTNSISNEGKDSSPFRRSNFDLLVLLSTQESIHRVLRQYKEDDDLSTETFDWLREFYTDRVTDHFDGHLSQYGRADKFLEELLLSPPSIHHHKGGGVHLLDPMKMAEDIIKMRSDVAREWKDMVSGIPEEHVDIRRLLLTRRMMERSSESNPIDEIVGTITETLKEEKATKKSGVVFETGSFE